MNLDRWKDILRSKIKDVPQTSEKDEEIWQNILREIEPSTVKKSMFHSVQWLGYAASFFLACSILGVLFFYSSSKNDDTKIVKTEAPSLQIPPAAPTKTSLPEKTNDFVQKERNNTPSPLAAREKSHLVTTDSLLVKRLSDGSTVFLNTHSNLELASDFSFSNREMTLSGEAYFEVVPNKTKPFLVHFEEHKLKVVGTSFSIRSVKGETTKEITVAEGIVEVYMAKDERPYRLTKGQQLIVHPSKEPKVQLVDPILYTNWVNDRMDFNQQPLETVFKLLSRKYNKLITFDPTVKDCQFTGDLTGLSLEEALSVVKHANSLHVIHQDGHIQISGQSCD